MAQSEWKKSLVGKVKEHPGADWEAQFDRLFFKVHCSGVHLSKLHCSSVLLRH